ncbi:uncharacterized protein EDB93DRAFT_1105117 [Suillus bovinus]|uniref:uncharacterized protein n=1 Tax=Suillus bovinus TaxID=48563 RepID=UPI001B874DDB|nr:uncharacterized protein EDB93DRAFT_1105117 [Suillus bovinus]KAG2143783.1 hypothetical protein EDB93DRAFT_1105117 [Suillus bovinus]
MLVLFASQEAEGDVPFEQERDSVEDMPLRLCHGPNLSCLTMIGILTAIETSETFVPPNLCISRDLNLDLDSIEKFDAIVLHNLRAVEGIYSWSSDSPEFACSPCYPSIIHFIRTVSTLAPTSRVSYSNQGLISKQSAVQSGSNRLSENIISALHTNIALVYENNDEPDLFKLAHSSDHPYSCIAYHINNSVIEFEDRPGIRAIIKERQEQI